MASPRPRALSAHPHRVGRACARLTVLIVSLLLPAAAFPHEIGTTRVAASVADDRTYVITVTTDAGTLLARLELARGRPRTTATSVADLQRALDAVCDDVRQHVTVRFDDVREEPRAECVVESESPAAADPFSVPGVTVTLRGVAPPGARVLRWRYGLTATAYALAVTSPARATETIWVEGDEESPAIALAIPVGPASRAAVVKTYLGLGFTHIVPKGLDHILFVLGLFLLSRRLRPLLWQVSAFTLAHSITLGLTIYGVIGLPPSIVEPLIALSIVYVAVENLWVSELSRWRVALVFAFGLLHGMGFAGVLSDLALPRAEFLTGLIAFNVGVEAGQLTVILVAFACVGAWVRRADTYRRLVVVPASLAIAVVGAFWTVQRLMS